MRKLGPQAHAVQQRQQALAQAWEALKLHMEQRKAQLEQACRLARFRTAVRAPFPGAARVCAGRGGWGRHVVPCMDMHYEALRLWNEKSVDMKWESMSTSEYRSGWPESQAHGV